MLVVEAKKKRDTESPIVIPSEDEMGALLPRWELMTRRLTNGAQLIREEPGDDVRVHSITSMMYRGHPTRVSFLLIDVPRGSHCRFAPEHTDIVICRPQVVRGAKELDLSPRFVEGAFVHHEVGHLDFFLRGLEPGTVMDWEVAAWNLARSEIHRHLPHSWSAVPDYVYAKVSEWALASYESV